MSSEMTTGPNVMAGDVITQPGLYESRGGDIVRITGWNKGWWVSEWHETVDWYGSDGRQRFRGALDTGRWDLLHWVRPLPVSEPEPETASEQLAEIEGQPAAQPQPQPVQVCEGRWRTRNGDIRNVRPTPEGDEREERWPWLDAEYGQTWGHDGRYFFSGGDSPLDLDTYLGPIEPAKTQEPQPGDTADELRSEVSYVQNVLRTEKRRVGELEELVTSLQRELAVAKAELTTAAAVCQQLQIELDAAQQVPADLPELRQLRLRLADMTLDRDQCKTAYDRIFADLLTIRETTKAEAVEAIVEWLEPVRRVDNPSLANETMQHLPQIMRHLTGLDSHAID